MLATTYEVRLIPPVSTGGPDDPGPGAPGVRRSPTRSDHGQPGDSCKPLLRKGVDRLVSGESERVAIGIVDVELARAPGLIDWPLMNRRVGVVGSAESASFECMM